jgi:Domain of unknown function (DUF4192)
MSDHSLRPHASRPPLRPRTLSDLVELVPYLLGFHPRDSLVVVALHGWRRRIGTTVRVDRAEFRSSAELPSTLGRYLRADGADEALAVVYGPGRDDGGGDRTRAGPRGNLPDRALVRSLAAGLAESEVFLVDALYVAGGRWWSYACEDPGCCPPAGRSLPSAAGRTSPVVAAATYAGLVAMPDRETLARTLDQADPVAPGELDRARAAVRAERSAVAADGPWRWRDRVREEFAAVVADVACGRALRLADAQVARFLVLLSDEEVRDACCRWTDGHRAAAALELWRYLARRAVPPYDVTPFALVAWVAWHLGSGPLARMAVDRALAADPTCRLALLLEEALDRGVNPMTVRSRPRGRRRVTRRGHRQRE